MYEGCKKFNKKCSETQFPCSKTSHIFFWPEVVSRLTGKTLVPEISHKRMKHAYEDCQVVG